MISQKVIAQSFEIGRNREILVSKLLVVKNSSPLQSVVEGIEVIDRRLEVITTILRRIQEAIRHELISALHTKSKSCHQSVKSNLTEREPGCSLLK